MDSIGIPAGRVLNFDIESRPLGWMGGDWVHSEPTAIACAWQDDPDSVECYNITKRKGSEVAMLKRFRRRYDKATVVVGHYIRGYDLSRLNAAYLEFDLPPLGDKYTHDTKGDLLKFSGMSKSQENLGAMLGLENPKYSMNMADWRSANRLEPAGIQKMRERAIADVLQNIEMHAELMRRGFVTPPKLWSAGDGVAAPGYVV